MGKYLIIIGLALLLIGLFIHFNPNWQIGKLPGDITIKKENFQLYIPITTSLLISLLLSLIIYFIKRFS